MHSVKWKSATCAGLLMALLPTATQSQTVIITPAQPKSQKGFEEERISKAALSGQQILIWQALMLNPDCTPSGTMVTEIVTPPRHGKAVVSDAEIFSSFAPPNPRAACNSRKSPGKQAQYTSEAGYRGRDRFVFQNATSAGRIRRFVVDIEIR